MTIKTAEEIAKYIHLLWPLQAINHLLAQKFGENKMPLYRALGYDGHQGWDLTCNTGTPILASVDGEVTVAFYGFVGYGHEIRLLSKVFDCDGQKMKLEIIYGHLSKILVKEGQRVSEGQIIGYSDNTGYSSGPHLHWEVRPQYEAMARTWVRDRSNGYGGAVDPLPLLESRVPNYCLLNYPVQDKYGFLKVQWREALTRFKSPAIHTALIKNGRTALSLSNDEVSALTYGRWTIDDVLAPTFPLYWQAMSYPTFKAREFELKNHQRESVL